MDPRSDFPTCSYQGEAAAVADYLARRLDAAAEEAFERHVFGCADCWAELRLAAEIRAAARSSSAASRPWRGALAVAAVFAVALLGGGLWWRATQINSPSPSPVLRGADSAALAVVLRRDADRVLLAWEAVAGAKSYRVAIFDAVGTTGGEIETSATEASMDLADPANSAASSARVSALDELRQTILSSPPIALR